MRLRWVAFSVWYLASVFSVVAIILHKWRNLWKHFFNASMQLGVRGVCYYISITDPWSKYMIMVGESSFLCWTVFELQVLKSSSVLRILSLTDFCTGGWKCTFNVGTNWWLAFNFRSWAIWPCRLVNVCLRFILLLAESYQFCLIITCGFFHYELGLQFIPGERLFSQYCLQVCLHMDCWKSVLFFFLQFWRCHCWFSWSKRSYFEVC